MKTRGQTTKNDETVAATLIRNNINVKLSFENQGLNRNQGDLIPFVKSSGNDTETKH